MTPLAKAVRIYRSAADLWIKTRNPRHLRDALVLLAVARELCAGQAAQLDLERIQFLHWAARHTSKAP